MTLFCKLWSEIEGFGKPGKVPTRDHNPGDLRHSPHSQHPGDPNAIGVIDNDEHGYEDQERQAEIYASRIITIDPETKEPCPPRHMTIKDAVYTIAPPNENNTVNYLDFMVSGFGGRVDAETPLARALEIMA